MKSDKVKFLLCGLFFIVLAAITFRCVWGADMVFSASDLNIGRLAQMKNNLPESVFGYFSSKPVLGSSGFGFRLFTLLLAVTPLEIFANTFYGLVLVFGSVSLVWFLRLWNRSWLASVFGALIAFWFNSIMLAAGGHAYKMEVLAFSVLSLCLIEKSVRAESLRRGVGFSLLAGLSIGVMMIEQQDVALLSGLFVGSYAIFRLLRVHLKEPMKWGAVLVPIAIVSLLLAGNTLMGSYKHNIVGAAPMQQGQGNGEAKWNYITQWSMVPSEWPDLVALGWSGWSSGNPEGPYWGTIGQSAEWETTRKGFQNFKLTSVYFGIIPFLFGGFGVVWAFRNRKNEEGQQILFWSVAGVLGLWLAFGKYSPLYQLFYQLPLVGNIRAPMKFMDNFQICLGIVAAYGLDGLMVDGKAGRITKALWIAGSVLGGLMLLAGLELLVFPDAQMSAFAQMGFESYAETMLENMSNAWIHGALLALVMAGLVFAVWKGVKPVKWVAVAFVVVLATDSLVQTSHYFRASNIASLKKGNVLINYLKEHQENERSYFLDSQGIYNQWLASDGPYHDLNIFNIWQMPRMSVEYKEFLGTVGRNQIRLWELSAIKYVAAPAGILQQLKQNPELGKQFKPVLNYQVPTAQGMRKDVLLEFKGAIPRFALFQNWETVPIEEHCGRLVSPAYNPQTTVLVDSSGSMETNPGGSDFKPAHARTTKCKASIDVNLSAPSILRFSQRYEEGWNVFVDGHPADLLRVDYLCMGVQVPAGEHTVEFCCVSGAGRFWFAVGLFLIALAAGSVLVRVGE